MFLWIGFLPSILAIILLGGCVSSPSSTPQAREARKVALPSSSQHCIALAMYWEARGEGKRGMQAIGSVVLNRVADGHFPDTPSAVVHQRGERPPCQFSWWCDGKGDHDDLWASALIHANELLTRSVSDKTGGALFFHNTPISVPWERAKTARIGNHIFYR